VTNVYGADVLADQLCVIARTEDPREDASDGMYFAALPFVFVDAGNLACRQNQLFRTGPQRFA
jgi:hypothetical protein